MGPCSPRSSAFSALAPCRHQNTTAANTTAPNRYKSVIEAQTSNGQTPASHASLPISSGVQPILPGFPGRSPSSPHPFAKMTCAIGRRIVCRCARPPSPSQTPVPARTRRRTSRRGEQEPPAQQAGRDYHAPCLPGLPTWVVITHRCSGAACRCGCSRAPTTACS